MARNGLQPRDDAIALAAEQPYPLAARFRGRFLPAFIAFAAVFLLLIGLTAQNVVEAIYLELAQRRAQTITRVLSDATPAAWARLMSGATLDDLRGTADGDALAAGFADTARHMNLPELKVYDLGSRVLFATDASEIGGIEDASALQEAIVDGKSSLVTKTLNDGARQYELYVPVFDEAGTLRAVFELYEPVTYLDALLLRAAVPTIAVPAGLLFLLLLTLRGTVLRAQTDIDRRSAALRALQARLASFVSVSAVDAARTASAAGAIESRHLVTTLFYSDIRDFSGFAEGNSPRDVVALLNRLMTLQVEAIGKHDGDVDKMIGDAVLARFDGDDGLGRAVAAAAEIQVAVAAAGLPRGLGIGVHRGDVIAGAIGPESRRDFTVIGDAVNVAARLCALAGAGEIVADADIAADGFGAIETVTVKGRVTPVAVRRRRGRA